jgi:enoyl-CoA hydratase/carnithine racemase
MNELVSCERDGAIATLTLNRPERHNSLVPELLAAFLEKINLLQDDAELRAVILQANGRSFSTGGDMRGFVEHISEIEKYADETVGLLNQCIVAMIALPAPIVAAVHGIVTGGSLGFVLASDIVLAAPQTTFQPFYSTVGLSPDGGWAVLLQELIGKKRAAEILFLDEALTAEQAVVWGLANRIVLAENLRDEAREIAQDIAAKKPGSVRRMKRLLWNARGDTAARLEQEHAEFLQHVVSEEAKDGMQDFLMRREKKA